MADGWVSARNANCYGGQCSVSPATILQQSTTGGYKTLSSGNYAWRVLPYNEAYRTYDSNVNPDAGYISDYMYFKVGAAPGKPTLISPGSSISTATPTYSWNAVSGATWYYLYVRDSTTSGMKFGQWYTAAQAGCRSGSGTCSVTPSATLAAGAATWWIVAWNEFGYGPWSDRKDFTVAPVADPILGLWTRPDGGQFRMEQRTSGSYTFVGKVTVQGTFWKERAMLVGDEVYWFNKAADGHYSGSTLVKGNLYWTIPKDLWIKGNSLVDANNNLEATK